MSQNFCPDCGAMCRTGDSACPECAFPLELELVNAGDRLVIPSNQTKNWSRVSQILHRSGMRVKLTEGPNSKLAWTLLPGLGLILLLASLFLGDRVVDKIWEPPVTTRTVMRLDDPDGSIQAAQEAATARAESDEAVDFLSEAFKTTDDQKQSALDEDLDLSQFVDRSTVKLDFIRRAMQEASLKVSVKDRNWSGTLIGENLILVDTNLLQGAFEREIRTVTTGRTIQEKAFYIVPMAGTVDGEPVECELMAEGQQVGLSLLRGPIAADHSFKTEFFGSVEVGEDVWVAKRVAGRFYPEKASVVDSVNITRDVKAQVLDADLKNSSSGSPAFNKYGDMVGIVLNWGGNHVVVPLMTVRERSPLLYKRIK